MPAWWVCGFLPFLAAAATAADPAKGNWEPLIRLPTEKGAAPAAAAAASAAEEGVTKWAVLVAGSSGYGNYRHQVRLRRWRPRTLFFFLTGRGLGHC